MAHRRCRAGGIAIDSGERFMNPPGPENGEKGQVSEKPLAPVLPAPEPAPADVPPTPREPTPIAWRVGIAVSVVLLGLAAYGLRDRIGLRGQSAVGVVFFFGLVAIFSANLRAVNWRTIAFGFSLQLLLAVLVLKVDAVYWAFERVGEVVTAST